VLTVERWRGYRFYFYSHEPSEPPHVHADARGCTAKFWLRPVTLARSIAFVPKELAELLAHVRQRQIAFEGAWHEKFGV
jgi:hypothetical protein